MVAPAQSDPPGLPIAAIYRPRSRRGHVSATRGIISCRVEPRRPSAAAAMKQRGVYRVLVCIRSAAAITRNSCQDRFRRSRLPWSGGRALQLSRDTGICAMAIVTHVINIKRSAPGDA